MAGGLRRLAAGAATAGAFLVPGIALWVPSGYSYGAVLLLLAALGCAGLWLRQPVARATWWLAGTFAAMAALWLLDVNVGAGGSWGTLDRPIKYLLVLPCVFYLMVFPPRTLWLWAGVACGALGSGALALYQTKVQGLDRATGFTNAIQYGNLSMLLAVMSGVVLLAQWRQWSYWQRVALGAAVTWGMAGSVLSQSRGGWLALGLLLPVFAWLLLRISGRRQVYWGIAATVLMGLAVFQLPSVEMRVDEARSEVQSYAEQGDGRSSVGHRLAHWQVAWEMGTQRPLLGWGQAGYREEKVRRVLAGQAHPSVLAFDHAHNEVLDLFAKRGAIGVLMLLIFYAVPLALFWPLAVRIRTAQGAIDGESLALCLVGVVLPLAYLGFGLTQVFLAHNSGNLFYLFLCPLILSALQQRRAQLALAAAASRT